MLFAQLRKQLSELIDKAGSLREISLAAIEDSGVRLVTLSWQHCLRPKLGKSGQWCNRKTRCVVFCNFRIKEKGY